VHKKPETKKKPKAKNSNLKAVEEASSEETEASENETESKAKKRKVFSTDSSVQSLQQHSQIIPDGSIYYARNSNSAISNATSSGHYINNNTMLHSNESFTQTAFLIRESNNIIDDDDENTRPFFN